MLRTSSFFVLALVSLLFVLAAGCAIEAPPRGPEATCATACGGRATQCSKAQCGHGCNLVLDRLAEHEGDHVIDCVALSKNSCDDWTWARCAARVGIHADGGPPAPPPPASVPSLEEEE